ncbi:hypothetical protein VHEMI08988 [[Torrubiella] hemipterigena]|nr:hypothetical protein VHEMI08988 [[Torrubiella] hemipterigena]
MAPSFLGSLRRRSRASFKTDRSVDNLSDDAPSNATPSSGSLTPPSISRNSDPALHLHVKDQSNRRSLLLSSSANSSRNSINGMPGLISSSSSGKISAPPLSKYAPRIFNANENSWVYQRVILLYGKIGDNLPCPIDGTITVSRFDDSVPPTTWPVCESNFKVLVYLQPGPNKIRFDFSNPKLANASTTHVHSSYLTLHMVPQLSAPPLDLAILIGKDSPGLYDSTPTRAEREGNGLQTAVRKFRMAAYLWQAFTAEQMWRNNLGRRAFRFEEEWTQGTTSLRDLENATQRSEARVHIIRSNYTVEELRQMQTSQQHGEDASQDTLFAAAAEDVKAHFSPLQGQKRYVSVMLLDSQWDPINKVVRGHTAQAGTIGDLHLATFGSHCLHSYPSTLEEVVSSFTDCTPTDVKYVSNMNNESGSSWEAANVGIGAHLHEIGHLFGCSNQEEGIMLKDYVVLNRSFVPREAYSTRTKSKGGLALQADECAWHRLDCLRFRSHPAFVLPCDAPFAGDNGVQAFALENGDITVTAATGISYIEIYAESDQHCRAWIEFPPRGSQVKREVTLTEEDLRSRLGAPKSKAPIRISVKSHAGASLDIVDIKQFTSKQNTIKLDNGKRATRSLPVGKPALGAKHETLALKNASRPDMALTRIVVFSGATIMGMEFTFDDNTTQIFGTKGEDANEDALDFDVRRGECLAGFVVRLGARGIEGIQIMTSVGRTSNVIGNKAIRKV